MLRRWIVAGVAVIAIAQSVGPVPSALAQGDPTLGTWVTVSERDEETVRSDIVDQEIKRATSRSRTRKPFKVVVPTGWRCNADYLYPDGRGRDREDGVWHYTYLVSPADGPRSNWTRTPTGERTCKVPAVRRPPAGRGTGPLSRRVSELAVLPAPTIGISPAEGVTGVPARFWATGIPEGWVSLPGATLDGKRVEIEARATAFTWDTGDAGTAAAQTRYSTDRPGAVGSPAVEHVYETKSSVVRPDGEYTITLDVTWERRYRVVGVADACTEWCHLEPGRTLASAPYRVSEVLGVLVP